MSIAPDAMAGACRNHAVVVRNTFVDFASDEAEVAGRGRPRSAPPARREAPSDTHAAQLSRLNEVWLRPTATGEQEGCTAPRAAAPASVVGKSLAEVSTESLPTWCSSPPETTEERTQQGDDEDFDDSDKDLEDSAYAPSVVDMESVPIDADGRYTSLGSRGQLSGACRPCAFARSAGGCKFGVSCDFCHFTEEHPPAKSLRPGKGKRARIRKAMASLEQQVARDPELLTSGELHVPKLVDLNPWARCRATALLAQLSDADGPHMRRAGLLSL